MATPVDLATFCVSDAMTRVVVSVKPTDKIDQVAALFAEKHIHSAPVVDGMEHCIGIITATDLIRFQSERDSVNSQLNRGLDFDVSHRKWNGTIDLVPQPFDEVQQQMSTCLQTVAETSTLRQASLVMCEQHHHHLVVLNDSQQPVGILSSLDILRKINEIG